MYSNSSNIRFGELYTAVEARTVSAEAAEVVEEAIEGKERATQEICIVTVII